MRSLVTILAISILVPFAAAEETTAAELLGRLEALPGSACAEIHAIGAKLAADHPREAGEWLRDALGRKDRDALVRALRVARHIANKTHLKDLRNLSGNRNPVIRPLALAALAFTAEYEDEARFRGALHRRPKGERWAALTGILARPGKRAVWLSVMGLAQNRFATGGDVEPDESIALLAPTGRFLIGSVRIPEKVHCETAEGREEIRGWQEEGGITDELLVGHLIPGCGTCRIDVYGMKDPYFKEAAIRGAVERIGRSRIAGAVEGVKEGGATDAAWLACGLYPSFPDQPELLLAVLSLAASRETPAVVRRKACRVLAYHAPEGRDDVLEALLALDSLEHLLAYRHSGMVSAIYGREGDAADRKVAMVMSAQRFRPEEKKIRFFHERDVEAIQAALKDPIRGMRYRAGMAFHGLATEIPRALPALRRALEQAESDGHERLADLLRKVLARHG